MKRLVPLSLLLLAFLAGKGLASPLDLNRISGETFVELTGLRLKPKTFERIRSELRGFEALDQLRLLFYLRSEQVESLTNLFNTQTLPLDLADSESDPDWDHNQGEEISPLPLNGLTAARLEELPGVRPDLARRIAHAIRQPGFSQRWQLLRVRGVSPAVYGQLRRYLEAEKAPKATPWKFSAQSSLKLRPAYWSGQEEFKLSSSGIESDYRLKLDSRAMVDRDYHRYGLDLSFPEPLSALSGYTRLSFDGLCLIIGGYRLRSSLGLLAGSSPLAGQALKEIGSGITSLPTRAGFSPATQSGLSLEWGGENLILLANIGVTGLALESEKITNHLFNGSLTQLFNPKGEARTRVHLGGVGLGWRPLDEGLLSLGWQREVYQLGFLPRPDRLTGEIRDHLNLTLSYELGPCLFSGEYLVSFESGAGTQNQLATAYGLGVFFSEGETRAELLFLRRSLVKPGLFEGLASALKDLGIYSLELGSLILDDLRLKAGFVLREREKSGVRANAQLEALWRPLSGFLLQIRASGWIKESDDLPQSLNQLLELKLGQTARLRAGLGLRAQGGKNGVWLASELRLALTELSLSLGYASWNSSEGLSLWPLRTVLARAGDGILPGVSGIGSLASLAFEFSTQNLDWGILGRLSKSKLPWKAESVNQEVELAAYLRVKFGD